MRRGRFVITTAAMILCASFVSANAMASECLPGIEIAVRKNPVYKQLYMHLASNRAELKALLAAVVDQTSYASLLTEADSIASTVEGGRLVVTLADGTVVVDTAAPDDPTNALPSGNSYAHFRAKTVNENHNSRVAIFAAQLYPCGIGVERKLSTSTGVTESYVALRLGRHLDSEGTARLSATLTDE
jgi:hypothetical protein